eukprot:1159273-Pelagomonas_calceolata.AAC.7
MPHAAHQSSQILMPHASYPMPPKVPQITHYRLQILMADAAKVFHAAHQFSQILVLTAHAAHSASCCPPPSDPDGAVNACARSAFWTEPGLAGLATWCCNAAWVIT